MLCIIDYSNRLLRNLVRLFVISARGSGPGNEVAKSSDHMEALHWSLVEAIRVILSLGTTR